MAFLRKYLEEEEKKRPTLMGGGVARPTAPAPQQAPQAPAQPQQSSGGRFPLLADYLNANKDAGQRMSDNALGRIESQGAQLASGKPPQSQDMGSNAALGKGLSKSAPTQLTQIQSDKERLDLAGQVEGQAKAAGLSGGAQSLLQQQNKGQYSQGEQMLDAGLVNSVAGQRMTDFSKKYSNLYDTVRGQIGARRAAESESEVDAARAAQKKADDEYAAMRRQEEEAVAGDNERRAREATILERARAMGFNGDNADDAVRWYQAKGYNPEELWR